MGRRNRKNRHMSARRKIRMLLSSTMDFLEGVDFAIPDRMYDRGRSDGAMYYATPGSMLKQIFRYLEPK